MLFEQKPHGNSYIDSKTKIKIDIYVIVYQNLISMLPNKELTDYLCEVFMLNLNLCIHYY